jgi:hypothetical protein
MTNTSPQTATNLGWVTQTTVTGLSFRSASVTEYFNYQNGFSGAYQVSVTGVFIQVLNSRGRVVAQGINRVNLPAARMGTMFHLKLRSAVGAAIPGYTLTIGLKPTAAAARKLNRRV